MEIGDQIALQYGGSEAHKKVASAGATSNIQGPMGKVRFYILSVIMVNRAPLLTLSSSTKSY